LEGPPRQEGAQRPGDAPLENRAAPGRATLAGVQRGDPEALAQFFEWCFDRVFSLVYRLLGDRTTAEDITQEVFVKIQQAAGRLDPDRHPGPWVTVIAYNACRDHWRSKGYREAKESTPIDEYLPTSPVESRIAVTHAPLALVAYFRSSLMVS